MRSWNIEEKLLLPFSQANIISNYILKALNKLLARRHVEKGCSFCLLSGTGPKALHMQKHTQMHIPTHACMPTQAHRFTGMHMHAHKQIIHINKSKLKTKLFSLWGCMCITMCVPGACWGQKKAQNPLKLELKIVVSSHVGAETWTWVLRKSSSVINSRAMSSVAKPSSKICLRCFSHIWSWLTSRELAALSAPFFLHAQFLCLSLPLISLEKAFPGLWESLC